MADTAALPPHRSREMSAPPEIGGSKSSSVGEPAASVSDAALPPTDVSVFDLLAPNREFFAPLHVDEG